MTNMTTTQKQYYINIISEVSKLTENWAANWYRYGRLQIASHKITSKEHLISKTIREAHNGEYILRAECWRKVNTKYPGIPNGFFQEVLHELLRQIYYNLKSDLHNYR